MALHTRQGTSVVNQDHVGLQESEDPWDSRGSRAREVKAGRLDLQVMDQAAEKRENRDPRDHPDPLG